MKQHSRNNTPLASLGVLFFMFLIAVIFWNTIFIYPIKIFVVILHEFSHGLAAILTGGKIVRIEISQLVGGVCYTMGGARFLVASAGYLGSIFWGGLILIIAARTRYDNVLGMIIGAFLTLLSLVYIRNWFGFLFTIGFGIGLIALSCAAKNSVIDLLMKFLGMTSCLYVLIDIKSDLIDRSGIGSDADAIALMLGAPHLSVLVGIVWALIAIVSFGCFLWLASQGDGERRSA